MVAECRSELTHIGGGEFLAEYDGVWNARVEKVHGKGFPCGREAGAECHSVGGAHRKLDAVAMEVCGECARKSFEDNEIGKPQQPGAEPGKAARAVAAHLRLAAISVEVAHAQVGPGVGGGFGGDESVRSDPTVPVAEACDAVALE